MSVRPSVCKRGALRQNCTSWSLQNWRTDRLWCPYLSNRKRPHKLLPVALEIEFEFGGRGVFKIRLCSNRDTNRQYGDSFGNPNSSTKLFVCTLLDSGFLALRFSYNGETVKYIRKLHIFCELRNNYWLYGLHNLPQSIPSCCCRPHRKWRHRLLPVVVNWVNFGQIEKYFDSCFCRQPNCVGPTSGFFSIVWIIN